jgi:hypothetical protein
MGLEDQWHQLILVIQKLQVIQMIQADQLNP